MKRVLTDYPGEVKIVYRNILKHGPISLAAAKAFEAVCLQSPNVAYDYYKTLYRHQNQLSDSFLIKTAGNLNIDIPKMKADMESAVVAERISADKKMADENHFNVTPSFLIGTQPVSGLYRRYSDFTNIIQEQLQGK